MRLPFVRCGYDGSRQAHETALERGKEATAHLAVSGPVVESDIHSDPGAQAEHPADGDGLLS
jgi:hypothetical protein